MTHAICLACGTIKFGSLLPCKSCGASPADRTGRELSMLLSDHFFDMDELHEISSRIAGGWTAEVTAFVQERLDRRFSSGTPGTAATD